MQNKKLKVLVFGGTGSQAKPVVTNLLANGHEPYVLTRNAKNAADLALKGAKVVIGNLADEKSLDQAMQGMDAASFLIPAFLKEPSEGKQYGLNGINCAKNANIKIFVWNLSGKIDEESTTDYRNELIRHLKKVKLPYILLEPTTYMENWLGPWTADYIKKEIWFLILNWKENEWDGLLLKIWENLLPLQLNALNCQVTILR